MKTQNEATGTRSEAGGRVKACVKEHPCQAGVAHAFHPSTQEAEAGDLCEFEASMVYKASSRTGSKTTQRNPDSENEGGGDGQP